MQSNALQSRSGRIGSLAAATGVQQYWNWFICGNLAIVFDSFIFHIPYVWRMFCGKRSESLILMSKSLRGEPGLGWHLNEQIPERRARTGLGIFQQTGTVQLHVGFHVVNFLLALVNHIIVKAGKDGREILKIYHDIKVINIETLQIYIFIMRKQNITTKKDVFSRLLIFFIHFANRLQSK